MNQGEFERTKYVGYLYSVIMCDIHRKDAYISPNSRLENCLEVQYCLSGEEKTRVDNKVMLFYPGCVRIVPPVNKAEENYKIKTTKKGKVMVIGYITMDPFVTKTVIIDTKGNAKIKELFEKLDVVWKGKYENFYFDAYLLFFELLKELRLLMSSNFSNFEHISNKLLPVMDYIHAHYTDKDFSFNMLPEMCGLKNNYFHKIFQRRYKTSPLKYVTNLRMSLATDLLFEGKMSISEIAENVGYETAAYFSQAFKKYYGISPSKYVGKTEK